MILNGNYEFKDIIAYLAPGTSLETFLKALDTKNLAKFIVEYPYLAKYKDNVIQLLKNSPIPGSQWFSNDLTRTEKTIIFF